APSYPQELLRDPTGAGDSFGGAFLGYLAKTGDLGADNIRRAVIIGSVMASFNIEDFSLERLKRLKRKEVVERFETIRHSSVVDKIPEVHLQLLQGG
ncbi:MAG: PfkB family carbohydrate kinase, partial [Candidatus Margulisbacteria bacterium]|nr:PfkB family carbohydrate kinase [Candidatus Margulisiibacteriota bacterium]